MQKKLLLIFMFLLITSFFIRGNDLISLTASDQNLATAGFEKNEYDWLINPIDFTRLTSKTLFFSLDSLGSQLSSNSTGDGIRAGFAFGGAMRPVALVNYYTQDQGQIIDPDNTDPLTFTNFDPVNNYYATVTRSVNITSLNNHNIHRVMLHSGLALNSNLGLALQVSMVINNWDIATKSFTDTYSNTNAPTESALTSKGNLTETTTQLRSYENNTLAFELEAGLNMGNFTSRFGLGGSINNQFGPQQSQQTVTGYSGGLNPVIRDSATITANSGQYYYNGSSVQSCFDMDSNDPSYIQNTTLNATADNTLSLGSSLFLDIPAGFQYNIYPALTTQNSLTTITYSDAAAANPETARSIVSTTTTLINNRDIRFNAGLGIRKTFSPVTGVNLHLGGSLLCNMAFINDTRTRARSTTNQIDGNADQQYTTAGSDTSTVYTESGYEMLRNKTTTNFLLTLPIGISYAPTRQLTFNAGTKTILSGGFTMLNGLTTGDANYPYETFTDNLVPANSYTITLKSGTNSASNTSNSLTSNFNLIVSGHFGATLKLAENFKIDALGQMDFASFYAFSLFGIYTFPAASEKNLSGGKNEIN